MSLIWIVFYKPVIRPLTTAVAFCFRLIFQTVLPICPFSLTSQIAFCSQSVFDSFLLRSIGFAVCGSLQNHFLAIAILMPALGSIDYSFVLFCLRLQSMRFSTLSFYGFTTSTASSQSTQIISQ